MNIVLGDLKEGSYRNVTDKEYSRLLSMLN